MGLLDSPCFVRIGSSRMIRLRYKARRGFRRKRCSLCSDLCQRDFLLSTTNDGNNRMENVQGLDRQQSGVYVLSRQTSSWGSAPLSQGHEAPIPISNATEHASSLIANIHMKQNQQHHVKQHAKRSEKQFCRSSSLVPLSAGHTPSPITNR